MTDPITIIAVLGLIADKVIDALLLAGSEKVVEETWGKLKGDKAKNAFKLALGDAILRYAADTGTRSALADPLLDENGLLTEQAVVGELAQILRFNREPNYQLIGDRWRAKVEKALRWHNFTLEAQTLTRYLKDELWDSEVFRSVLDSNSLNEININVSIATEALTNIEEKLVDLREIIDSRLGEFIRIIAGTNLKDQIIDSTWKIQEWTDGFTGRQFVFKKIEQFIRENPRGYFHIRGDPGIGKTALIAEWVKKQGSIHHFNSRSEQADQTKNFLKNVCAQLIAIHNLDYEFLPPEAEQDSGFLTKLLHEISKKLKPKEWTVIAIDALDEVSEVGSANLLYLPKILPKGIYVVDTARPKDHFNLNIDCEQEEWLIERKSNDNLNDIRQFIIGWTDRNGVQAYISAQEIDQERFIDYMTNEKSDGNFMYLRYVLRDIELGIYNDLSLSKLPIGLEKYYEDHWHRMKVQSDDLWSKYKIPVLEALSLVKEPATIERIMRYSGVQDRSRVVAVLKEWREFLYKPPGQKRYYLYHDSFREFIAQQEEVDVANALLRIVEQDSEELSEYE